MRKLDLTSDAHKFLSGLPAKQFRQVLLKTLDLMKDPRPHDSKALQGFPYYRVDVGEFRIVYTFDSENLRIAKVGKRNDAEVYRNLKR